jgi:basic membrane protein A
MNGELVETLEAAMSRRLWTLLVLLSILTLAACGQGQRTSGTALPLPEVTAAAPATPSTAGPTDDVQTVLQLFAPTPGAEQSLLGLSQLDQLLAAQGLAVRSSNAPSHRSAIDALCRGDASFVWLSTLGYLAAKQRCPDIHLLFAVEHAASPALLAAAAATPADTVQTFQTALAAIYADEPGRAALEAIGGWSQVASIEANALDPLAAAIATAGIADLAAWPGVSQPLRVGLVTDGGRIDDGSLNQSIYAGLQRAAAAFDLTVSFIETVQPDDWERNIATFGDASYDVIFTVGPLMAELTQNLAERYPASRFIAVNAGFENAPANLQGILFREDQAGFLAGVLAGQLSASQTVGVVTGTETPAVLRYRHGFASGVASVCPACEVIAVAIDRAADQTRGRTAALRQIAEGADIIFGVGGPTGAGALLSAAQDGVWAIGAEVDQYVTTFGGGETPGADRLVTSAIPRADVAAYTVLADIVMGRFQSGQVQADAASGGIGLAPFHQAAPAVSTDLQAQLLTTLQDLASGHLTTGVDPTTGNPLP